MTLRTVLLAALLCLSPASYAIAATVTVTFSGIVNDIKNVGAGSPFSLGDRLTTTFSYDDAQIVEVLPASATIGGPTFPVSFAQAIGGGLNNNTTGQFFAENSQGTTELITTSAHPVGAGFEFSTFISMGNGDGASLWATALHKDRNYFQDPSLAAVGRILAGGDFSSFDSFDLVIFGNQYFWNACATDCRVTANIDTVTVTGLTAVPVPPALPLMALGLMGLGLIRQRRNPS